MLINSIELRSTCYLYAIHRASAAQEEPGFGYDDDFGLDVEGYEADEGAPTAEPTEPLQVHDEEQLHGGTQVRTCVACLVPFHNCATLQCFCTQALHTCSTARCYLFPLTAGPAGQTSSTPALSNLQVVYLRENVAVWPSSRQCILGRLSLVKQARVLFIAWLPYGRSAPSTAPASTAKAVAKATTQLSHSGGYESAVMQRAGSLPAHLLSLARDLLSVILHLRRRL